MSVWQTPQATSRTSTSPSRGSGSATSCTTSGLANSSSTAARILMSGRSPLRDPCEQALLAGEGLARGGVDLDHRQLPGAGQAAEVDDLVVASAPPQPLGVGARGAFDEDLDGPPDEPPRAPPGPALDETP